MSFNRENMHGSQPLSVDAASQEAHTFGFWLGAQVPVEDAVDALQRGLPPERLVRDRIDDVLVVRAVTSLNEIRVVLSLQCSVDSQRVRRLERKQRSLCGRTGEKCWKAPRIPRRDPALSRVSLPIEVGLVETRPRL